MHYYHNTTTFSTVFPTISAPLLTVPMPEPSLNYALLYSAVRSALFWNSGFWKSGLSDSSFSSFSVAVMQLSKWRSHFIPHKKLTS